MEYIVRLVHVHQSFRKPELVALASLAAVHLEIISYSDSSPFCIIRLPDEAAAQALIARAVLSYAIYELWGQGADYDAVHQSVKTNKSITPEIYRHSSFRFAVDTFHGKRDPAAQKDLIESFSYLPFDGPIKMNDAELDMSVFEDFTHRDDQAPTTIYLGRLVAKSDRRSIEKYDLKKRHYISRTSMDAELSLVTANLTLAAPGKLFFDPFVGTGSFAVTSAHFGATALGSDIDGRSIRGQDGRDLLSNFAQYGQLNRFLDSFVSDLTHTPLRHARLFDGIVCDPPYGVREGPKVLGHRYGKEAQIVLINGLPAHLYVGACPIIGFSPLLTFLHRQDGYIPPKRPYGFDDMLADVLEFAAFMLVDHGRLSMWMPTADDEDIELAIPTHPSLELVSVCVQHFTKWARRLLTYQRLPGNHSINGITAPRREPATGRTADDLNRFRKKYFQGFKTPEQ